MYLKRLRLFFVTSLIAGWLPVISFAEPTYQVLKQVKNLVADRIVEVAVSVARLYAEVTYGDTTVDGNLDTFSISNIKISPINDVLPADCNIAIGSFDVSVNRDMVSGRDQFTIGFANISVSQFCMPFETRAIASMMGIRDIKVPNIQLEFKYQVKSGLTEIVLYTGVEKAIDITASAKFDYLSIVAYNDFPFIGKLNELKLIVENTGLWEVIASQLPPELNNPSSASLLILDFLQDNGPMVPNQTLKQLYDQLPKVAEDFLENPTTLSINSNITAPQGLLIDQKNIYDLDGLLQQLNLEISAGTKNNLKSISGDTISAILSGSFEAYSDSLIFELAEAFLSGRRVPKNYENAVLLLTYLRDAGVAEAEPLLVEAYINLGQYAWAYETLQSLASQQKYETASYFSLLEKQLTLSEILLIQENTKYIEKNPYDDIEINYFRRAQSHFRGNNAIKSYELAYYWAILAHAVGDVRGKNIITQLDNFVSKLSGEAKISWQEKMKSAQNLATEHWKNRTF